MKRMSLLLAMMSIILMLSACGSQEAAKQAVGGAPAEAAGEELQQQEDAAYPRTITHEMGTITLDKKPERVALTDVNVIDYMLALDEVPIGARIATMDRSPKLKEIIGDLAITSLGGKVNMETLISLEPDLIIISTGKADNYERESKVASTVVVDGSPDRTKRLRQIAKIFNKEEKAEQLIQELNEKIEQAKKAAQSRQDETVLFLRSNGKDFTVLTPESHGLLYEKVGLKPVAQFPDQGQIGVESISTANPDHIFIVENRRQMDADNVGALISIWDNNPVWQNLRAVKSGHLYVLDPLIADDFFYGWHMELDAIIEHLGK